MSKVSEVDFSIKLMWVHGLSVSQIYKSFGKYSGKSSAAIRGIIDRNMEKPRSEMTMAERQEILDDMKNDRKDSGRFPDVFFTALPLQEKQKKPADLAQRERPPHPTESDFTPERLGRILSEAEYSRAVDDARSGKGHHASAGALETLYNGKMLAEPDELAKGRIVLVTVANNARRMAAGERLRAWLYCAYQSGLKTQNYEATGSGGGAGVVIHATVVEALTNLEKVKEMISREEFALMDQLLRMDAFVWEVDSDLAKGIVLEDIRRSLDTVSVFLMQMSPEAFKARWGSHVGVSRVASKKTIKRRANRANEAIAAAQRKLG